jgi:glutathione S-transferase
MGKLVLIGTPLSHFTRKVRIALHELEIPFDFEPVNNLLEADATRYGQNPLMRVPTLIDGDRWLIESDHIVRHVIATRAPHDPLNALTPTIDDLNQLSVLNGIMAHEVTLILAARGGLADVMVHTYFQKLSHAITSGLSWVDQTLDSEREGFNYVDVVTICMWEHLVHYGTVPGLQSFQRIAERVARFSTRDSVARTTPQASLEAARLS